MRGAPLAVVLDGTPLLGRRTGVGRYTEHLLRALAARGDLRTAATAFTLRGWRDLAAAVPDGVTARSRPAPARLLRSIWSRAEFPPVGLIAGGCDVFHGTNFVLPPTGRAGGVVTVHDLTYLTMPDTVDATSRALLHLVPRSLRRAAAVCTPSQAVADQVRETYGPIVPEVVVTPLGVDELWFRAAPPDPADLLRLGLPAEYLLFVGTREPRKNLPTLLAAYRAAGDAAGESLPELVLIGPDGWGDGVVPVPGVRILGYFAQRDLAAAVAGATAVVLPSRDEGFGLPALEALAAGSAVIVSDIPALREVTGGHAHRFAVGDVDALAGLLLDVGLAGPATDEQRSMRRTAAAAWTWERCAERTVHAYRLAA